ncbi:MAG: GTPase Era [Myxococcaceae bacterium]
MKRRSGFAALIGRPNVGKSTLLNRIVGERLAIVSHKPQTTRRRLLGVLTRPGVQLALVDTPGLHEAKGALHKFMLETTRTAVRDVDVVALVVEAAHPCPTQVHRDDARVCKELSAATQPVFLVINKVDRVPRASLLPFINLYRELLDFREVFPVSARSGEGVDALVDGLAQAVPEGEFLFPQDSLTDESERSLAAEYIREQVLHQCGKEVPYATAVRIENFDETQREATPKKRGLVHIDATILVERDGQKAIIIGRGGAMLKSIGTEARKSIERLVDAKVYLALHVKVEPRWSERPALLRELGYQ